MLFILFPLTKKIFRGFVFFVLFFGFACGATPSSDNDNSNDDNENADNEEDEQAALTMNDWAYVINGPDLNELGESAYDLLVIDYSADGSQDEEFSSDEIEALKNSDGGNKIVLAYMSIGEAEDYRFYFDPNWVDPDTNEIEPGAPDFLVASNPDFPNNYKVKYWDEDWQALIFGTTEGDDKSYLDRILDAGFDGVYLDIIDAFEYFGPGGESGEERPTAGSDMIQFVLDLAEYARVTRGQSDFLIFPQNGAAILDEEGGDDYLDAVNGIGAEDTFYFGDEENNNNLDLDHAGEVIDYLDQFVEADKTVLAIDYVQDENKISDFYDRASNRGYIPYTSTRELDSLTINDGFEPD